MDYLEKLKNLDDSQMVDEIINLSHGLLDRIKNAETPTEYAELIDEPIGNMCFAIALKRDAFMASIDSLKKLSNLMERMSSIFELEGDKMLKNPEATQAEVDLILEKRNMAMKFYKIQEEELTL